MLLLDLICNLWLMIWFKIESHLVDKLLPVLSWCLICIWRNILCRGILLLKARKKLHYICFKWQLSVSHKKNSYSQTCIERQIRYIDTLFIPEIHMSQQQNKPRATKNSAKTMSNTRTNIKVKSMPLCFSLTMIYKNN